VGWEDIAIYAECLCVVCVRRSLIVCFQSWKYMCGAGKDGALYH
jgi:hypothetical protein